MTKLERYLRTNAKLYYTGEYLDEYLKMKKRLKVLEDTIQRYIDAAWLPMNVLRAVTAKPVKPIGPTKKAKRNK